MMKKIYVVPETVVMQFLEGEELCVLTGYSTFNESDDTLDSTGNTDSTKDPEWGIAGSKKFDAWSTWDE